MIPSDVITLDDDREYLLVEEYEYNDKKYFLAVGLLPDGKYDKNDVKFFIDDTTDGEEYVIEEDDQTALRDLFALVGMDVSYEMDPSIIGKIDEYMKYQEN